MFSLYRKVKKKAFIFLENSQLEKSLYYFQSCASFARKYHIGIWKDEELEKGLHCISKKLSESININAPDNNKALFISSSITDYGGHTAAMINWIECIKEEKRVFFINTYPGRRFGEMSEKVLKEHTEFIDVPSNHRMIERVKFLKQTIKEVSPQYIVLFIDPDDVVAVTALTDLLYIKRESKPIVYFFNHADHLFWLGVTVIDILINFRKISVGFSEKIRHFNKTQFLIPLQRKKREIISSVSMPLIKSKTLSLSIGASWKIVPDGYWDYFGVIRRILLENPEHAHILISKLNGALFKKALSIKREFPERFYLLSDIPNPDEFYKMSDFIIETFPVVGGTVRVDVASRAKPIVCIKNNKCPLLSYTDDIPPDYPLIATTNEEVVSYASQLIKNPSLRKKLGTSLLKYFYNNQELRNCKVIKELFSKNLKGSEIKEITEVEVDEDYLFNIDMALKGLRSPYFFMVLNYLNDAKWFDAVSIVRHLYMNDALHFVFSLINMFKKVNIFR